MRTTGQIARVFREADNGTIIRKPNMRRFAKDNSVFHHILPNGVWLIDIDELLQKLNPNQIDVLEKMPILRNIDSAVKQFNQAHPEFDIDRHTVEKCLLSRNVSIIKHGNRWVINYNELEEKLIRMLRNDKKV